MGSVKKVVNTVVRAGLAAGTFGVSEVVNAKNKKPKVSAYTGDLQQEARKTAAQRKNLLMTGGGILGEEVEGIGKKKRGLIFGN